MPIIPATQEMEMGGSTFKTDSGKKKKKTLSEKQSKSTQINKKDWRHGSCGRVLA
jgi:hypothetical protein